MIQEVQSQASRYSSEILFDDWLWPSRFVIEADWTRGSRPARNPQKFADLSDQEILKRAPTLASRKLWSGTTVTYLNYRYRYSVTPPTFSLRKEVIQPQVLLRLPCYDFTPIMNHTLGLFN